MELDKEIKLEETISNFEDFLIGYESESNIGLLDQYRLEFKKYINWEKDDEFLKDEAKKLTPELNYLLNKL